MCRSLSGLERVGEREREEGMELKADLDEKPSQEGNCPQFKLNLNPRLAFKNIHNSTY